MATISLRIQTSAGTFTVTTQTTDADVQDMVDAIRAANNIAQSTPIQVLTFQANQWMGEINTLVTQYRATNVNPLKLTLA